jgi:hypothetical protein
MKDTNLDKVRLSATFEGPERKAHSLEAGNENYRNPFDLEMIKNKPIDFKNPMPTEPKGYDKAVDKLLSGGLDLRERMFLAEKNKDLDLSSAIEDLLQSSSNNSLIIDHPKQTKPAFGSYPSRDAEAFLGQNPRFQPVSKDAELEALKLRMDYPHELIRPPQNQQVKVQEPIQGADYSDIKRHKLFIKFFKILNPLLKERLKGKRLTLEVLYPVLASQKPSPPEVYKFFTDEDLKQEQFMINQEIDSELDLQKIGIQKLCSHRVGLVIWMKGLEASLQGKDVEICRGELSLEQILLSKNFELKAQIPMRIVLGDDRMKKVSITKDNLAQLAVMSSEAGFINLETKFFNPETLNFQKQLEPTVTDTAVQEIARMLGQTSGPGTRSYRDLSSNPVCMFLHVKDARCMPRKDDFNSQRNLYLEHKVYGTPENIQSEIYWNNNTPIMDHKVIIPLDHQSIDMMVNKV